MLYKFRQLNNIKDYGYDSAFKRILSFILPCLLPLFISFNLHAEIRLSLQPNPVIAGEPASLTISSSEGKATINSLPKISNIKWLENKNNYTESIVSINGETFEQTNYQFIVSKPGVLTLPLMKITVGNNQYHTNQKKIRVNRGELTDLEKKLYITPKYLIKNRKDIYIGEEIPLKIDLFKSDFLSAVPAEYPKIKLNNIVFGNFSKFNRENDKFAPYPYGTPKHIAKDGINYTKTSFFTSFRALGSGLLRGTVSLLCNIKLSKSGNRRLPSGFNNSFFGNSSFFSGSLFDRGQTVSRLLVAKLPKLNILPRPAPPTGTNYLGLVGNWKITAKLPAVKVKEGEPLTLSLKITGTGSLETLFAPELSISGFTAYPPEIKKSEHNILVPESTKNVTINYVLIPTESGKTKISLSFATFNPNKGQYETAVIKKNINIIPSRSAKSIVFENAPSSKKRAITGQRRSSKVSNVILYLKKTPGNYVLIPLWQNHLGLVIALLLLGPLLWIIIELFYFRKNRFVSNPTLKRRNNALKKKKYIIRKITKTDPNNLPDIVQQEIIPFINDLKGFSPGTTADELFVKLKERTLAEYIKEVNTLSYMPMIKENTLSLRNNLVKALKRVSLFAIIGFTLLSFNNKVFARNNNISPQKSSIEQLIAAYNNADFTKAEKICKKNIHLNRLSANWLYNLGNCYYQNDNIAKAMVCYTQALLLAPRDSDIFENLNFVRRKLLLPEVYEKRTPKALLRSLRDTFRLDEWILIFALAWFLIFISLSIRRFTPAKIWCTSILAAILLAILSLTAAFSENAVLYNNKKAIVVQKKPKIFSLPSTESSAATFALSPGDKVSIEEKLNDWVRIRKDHAEGWLKKDSIQKVWPY